MIDNEKVKNAIAGWAKFPIYSKTETDFFDQCGYIGNFSKNEVITFYAGYTARDKEAEEEKRELLEALIDIKKHADLIDFGAEFSNNLSKLIAHATGKSIEEVLNEH